MLYSLTVTAKGAQKGKHGSGYDETTNPTEGPILLIRKNLSCSSTNLTMQA